MWFTLENMWFSFVFYTLERIDLERIDLESIDLESIDLERMYMYMIKYIV